MHAKQQQKLSHKYNLKKDLINYNSKISIDAEIYNQGFNTENKFISEDNFVTGSYYRFFPILGISSETPFKFKKYAKHYILHQNSFSR